jgi:hypothetical protein
MIRATLIITLAILLFAGCTENTVRPPLDEGAIGTSGEFIDETGVSRRLRVNVAFDELYLVRRFPEQRPWLDIVTGPVHVTSTGTDDFMSRVEAGLEGASFTLTYQQYTPSVIRLLGRISARTPEGSPFELLVQSEFEGQLGENGVPVEDFLFGLPAQARITDDGVGPGSVIDCREAALDIRGVGALVAAYDNNVNL